MTMPAIFALAAGAMFGISTAGAQTGRTSVGGNGHAVCPRRPSADTAPSLPTTGAEGTAIGVTAEAGASLTPHLYNCHATRRGSIGLETFYAAFDIRSIAWQLPSRHAAARHEYGDETRSARSNAQVLEIFPSAGNPPHEMT